MKFRILSASIMMAMVLGPLGSAVPAMAAKDGPDPTPIPVDIDPLLKDRPAPERLTPEEVQAAVSENARTKAECSESTDFMVLTLTSNDPQNPLSQDVVFWKESVGSSATLWVAWDFLSNSEGDVDLVTCEMLEYLQGTMDKIVDTDVYYYGQFDERGGNTNLDVMIYNIVDESWFDPDYPFYIAGYFYGSLNESNDRNMIFVDTYDWPNRLGPDGSPWRGDDASLFRPNLYEGTVAHELQHLIHHDMDIDEESWIDEGMADLAEYLNGYGHPDGHVVYYLAYHRTSLTLWGGGLEDYGASYLFQLYLLENFGTTAGCTDQPECQSTGWDNTWTRKEITEQANSIAGVEASTGAAFSNLFDSWVLANYLDDPSEHGPGAFPLGYNKIDLTPFTSSAYSPWSIARGITDIYGAGHHGNLPTSRYYGGYISGTVEYPIGELPPYAAAYGLYKGMEPEMDIALRGDAESGVSPVDGDYEAASGGGHLLTDRMLALNTEVGGTLAFKTWFDIEENWDYGFVEASTDGGGTWTPLPGTITRESNNPNNSTAWGNSLVSGQSTTNTAITGSSDGWVDATFDLPADSGVLVRFSYYTDEAVNGKGWFIDDVSVSSGFSDGFEAGDGSGWDLGGWTVTSGLFANDWIAGYVNPVYKGGQLQSTEFGYFDGAPDGGYERISGAVDTNKLGKGEATAFFANRPGESPFDSGYLILVDKGDASN